MEKKMLLLLCSNFEGGREGKGKVLFDRCRKRLLLEEMACVCVKNEEALSHISKFFAHEELSHL